MTDRDQVAREVLTELANWNMARVETLKDATRFRDERYPDPAAPVTVTVGDWKCSVVPHARDCIVEHIQRAQLPFTSPQGAPLYECVLRIAADARRIEELERERDGFEQMAREYSDNADYYRRLVVQIGETCGRDAYVSDDGSVQQDVLCAKVPELVIAMKHERDEARRALADFNALAQLEAATSQGEGPTGGVTEHSPQVQEGGAGSTPAQSVPSPAPIPLGAVVNDGRTAWMYHADDEGGLWEAVGLGGSNRWVYAGERHYDALCALWRATHADAATVERVAAVFAGAMVAGFVPNDCARRVLRALGYEVAE